MLLRCAISARQLLPPDLIEMGEDRGLAAQAVEIVVRGRAPPGGNVDLELPPWPRELSAYLSILAPLLPARDIAVDAGTGDGALLDVIAPLFRRVFAFDRKGRLIGKTEAATQIRFAIGTDDTDGQLIYSIEMDTRPGTRGGASDGTYFTLDDFAVAYRDGDDSGSGGDDDDDDKPKKRPPPIGAPPQETEPEDLTYGCCGAARSALGTFGRLIGQDSDDDKDRGLLGEKSRTSQQAGCARGRCR